jgi:hypothetical protein
MMFADIHEIHTLHGAARFDLHVMSMDSGVSIHSFSSRFGFVDANMRQILRTQIDSATSGIGPMIQRHWDEKKGGVSGDR